jgi:hypothetical protein
VDANDDAGRWGALGDQPVQPAAYVTHRTRRSGRYGKPSISKPRVPVGWGPGGFRCGPGRDVARAGPCCRPGQPERPGRDRGPGRAGRPRAAGMAGGRSGRSWPVGGAAGRRSEHLAGAGRAGGDGGLCAARCGSTARAGWQGWLLTVWPGLGQHGPGARRSPAAYRRGSGTCGPGDDASPPGAAGPLILIPPEDRGPALGPFPGRPDGRPGNPRSSPAAACMTGGRAGSTSRAAGPPDGQGGGSCGHRAGRPARAASLDNGVRGRRQALAGGAAALAAGSAGWCSRRGPCTSSQAAGVPSREADARPAHAGAALYGQCADIARGV